MAETYSKCFLKVEDAVFGYRRSASDASASQRRAYRSNSQTCLHKQRPSATDRASVCTYDPTYIAKVFIEQLDVSMNNFQGDELVIGRADARDEEEGCVTPVYHLSICVSILDQPSFSKRVAGCAAAKREGDSTDPCILESCTFSSSSRVPAE
jgi:hypothetical protein